MATAAQHNAESESVIDVSVSAIEKLQKPAKAVLGAKLGPPHDDQSGRDQKDGANSRDQQQGVEIPMEGADGAAPKFQPKYQIKSIPDVVPSPRTKLACIRGSSIHFRNAG